VPRHPVLTQEFRGHRSIEFLGDKVFHELSQIRDGRTIDGSKHIVRVLDAAEQIGATIEQMIGC
jgi:hypothetical protein